MNIEKINDVIDAYSRAIEMPSEYSIILKELIPKMIEKYSKQFKEIPIEQDDSGKYIIKPVDGKYSMEDFFLNRLMRNVLYTKNEYIDGKTKGNYDPGEQALKLDIDLLDRQLDGVLDTNTPNLQELKIIAKKKVIMHEFEHALQTQFRPKAYISAYYEKNYKNICNELAKIKDGKYRSIMHSKSEMKKKLLDANMEVSGRYSGLKHNGLLEYETTDNHDFYDNINEIFNETEALEMSEAKVQDQKIYPNGIYFTRKNNESSNRNITNYGDLIKVLLGEKWVFRGMYINPQEMFQQFDSRYNDIFQEAFQNNDSAWDTLVEQINKIKQSNLEEDHLKLNFVLSKCFNKKVNKDLKSKDADTKQLIEEFKVFKSRVLNSNDKAIRDNLEHIQILREVRDKITERINSVSSHQMEQEQTTIASKQEKSFNSTISNIKDTVLQGKVFTSEKNDKMSNIKSQQKARNLWNRSIQNSPLSKEEQLLLNEHIRQTNEAQVRFRNQQDQKKSKGLSL